jgi:hypothetical protein
MLAEFFIASSRLILGAPLLTRRMDHYSGLRRHDRAPQIQKAPRHQPQRLLRHLCFDWRQLVCWIAESSQLLPRGRTKVQTSVTSTGRSLPSTTRPLAGGLMSYGSDYPALFRRAGNYVGCDVLVVINHRIVAKRRSIRCPGKNHGPTPWITGR